MQKGKEKVEFNEPGGVYTYFQGIKNKLLVPIILNSLVCSAQATTESQYKIDFESEIHRYYETTAQDSFHQYINQLHSLNLDALKFKHELDALRSILKILEIPESSQVLVFSNTSLQLSKINPHNPRAIFFKDDLYLGYVPGGFIEILAIDPERGVIPYEFDLPRDGNNKLSNIRRSDRCMRCHATEKTFYAPGLLMGSVVPVHGGGTLDTLNKKTPSHETPYPQKFGGWFVNSNSTFDQHWGNSFGFITKGEIQKKIIIFPNQEITRNHLLHSSDPIALLVLEHQIGFTNLCIQIQYLKREISISPTDEKKVNLMDQLCENLLDYCFFVDEPLLPSPLPKHNSSFAREFEHDSKRGAGFTKLKILNLQTRLFETRCSFMLGSPSFHGLPNDFKSSFLRKMLIRLNQDRDENKVQEFSEPEKNLIRSTINSW